MKSQFRTNVENALVLAGAARLSQFSTRVFIDHNKCSDRIKFTDTYSYVTEAECQRIVAEVQEFYPGEKVRVYTAGSGNWFGVAVTVSHKPGYEHRL